MRPGVARRRALIAACLAWAAVSSGQQHWGGGVQKVQGGAIKLDVHESPEAVVVALRADVLFDFDKSDLKAEAGPALGKVAEIVARYPRGNVLVEGYTDGIGSDSYNVDLSERRAGAVKAWLVSHGGVAEGRIATKGWGKARPVSPNTHEDGSDYPEGRAKNRRVEVTVRKR